MESLRLTTTFGGAPEDVYDAWITGKLHAEMTGSPATSEKRKGGSYTAWDGYISGKYLELEPARRVLQTWRTTDFPETAPDSRLEVRFGKASRGTQLTLLQSGIPDGQGEMYTEGWQQHYFDPMGAYFRKAGRGHTSSAAKAKPKAATKRAVASAAPAKKKKKKKTASSSRGKAKSTGKSSPAAKAAKAAKTSAKKRPVKRR